MVETVINQNDGFIQITAVGGETELDGDFPIYEKSHVTIIRERSGVETPLVLNTDFTIADNQLEVTAGFTAVLAGSASPAVAADVYTLLLDVPEERTTDFSQAGDFKASTVNRELDLATQQIQQLRRDVNKSARLPDTSALTDLPLPTPTADLLLGWNAAADALENKTPNTDTYLSVSSFVNTNILPAASASAVRDAIGINLANLADSLLGVSSLGLYDGVGISGFQLNLEVDSNLSANRTLTFNVNNSDIDFDLGGDITIANDFSTSGNFGLTLTTTGSTNVTLPTSGTLVAGASGTYTPTVTGVTNVAAAAASGVSKYTRIGDMVQVFGVITVDPTSTGSTQVGISLPIASAFASSEDAAGNAAAFNVAENPACIYADTTNDRLQLDFIAADTANRFWYFTAGYQVI